MKRVICIEKPNFGFGHLDDHYSLIVGETYNVKKEENRPEGLVYFLEERPCFIWYHHKLFALTSEIDETQMERNYQKQSV